MKTNTIARLPDRRHFIGGSDARIILGQDEKALIRLWREKRGEVGPEDLSANLIGQLGMATKDLNRPWYGRGHERDPRSDDLLVLLPEPDAGTAATLFEELDSGLPEGGLDFLSSIGPTAQKTIVGLKPLDRGDRDIRSRCQLLL
jgi:hypothetical protein